MSKVSKYSKQKLSNHTKINKLKIIMEDSAHISVMIEKAD